MAQRFIRDNEGYGLMMIPLFWTWGIHRCNVEGCTNKPSTIGSDDELNVGFGLCEKHFQETTVPGGASFDLVFDDFDAFAVEQSMIPKPVSTGG